MKFILGKKLGMTQVFSADGDVVPVTRVQAGPCRVVQIKKDGVKAVQIGFGEIREQRLRKPQIGHLNGLSKVRFLRDFKVQAKDLANLERGAVITVAIFKVGDKVMVTGDSKGKGFQGVVRRHGFHGSPASHGHKDQLRMPGSIGAGGPQRVFKGTRMAGRMGGNQVTVKNLEVVEIYPVTNELYIKGAVPGANNGLLIIKAEGDLSVATPALEPNQANQDKNQEETVRHKNDQLDQEKEVK